MIQRDVCDTLDRTPLVELSRLARGLPGRVVGKLEMRNPCGRVKDRLGVALIDDAERRGVLSSPAERSSRRPGATPASAWLSSPQSADTGSS